MFRIALGIIKLIGASRQLLMLGMTQDASSTRLEYPPYSVVGKALNPRSSASSDRQSICLLHNEKKKETERERRYIIIEGRKVGWWIQLKEQQKTQST
jgi:hypothetical protein